MIPVFLIRTNISALVARLIKGLFNSKPNKCIIAFKLVDLQQGVVSSAFFCFLIDDGLMNETDHCFLHSLLTKMTHFVFALQTNSNL